MKQQRIELTTNRVVFKYNPEYEDQGGYVVDVLSFFDSKFIRCLFFASKKEALDFMREKNDTVEV